MNKTTILREGIGTTASPRRLYRVKFRTHDRPAPLGVSVLDVVATCHADAICRAGLMLDDVGERDWALESCEVAS